MKKTFALSIALGLMPITCIAVEPWDYLEIDYALSRTIAVSEVTISKDGKFVSFNVLDGYFPTYADLGYGPKVMSRVRFAIHRCGSNTAEVKQLRVRDEKGKIFVDEAYVPLRSIPLISDDAIRRAALYGCGDMSQKVGEVVSAPPRDATILVCRDESSGKEHSGEEQTFTVSEKTGTVDGKKADFTPATIKYKMLRGGGSVFVLEVNRYSGSYSITQEKDSLRLYQGKCVKQDKQQF